jgi:hypothetical protein
VDSYSKFKKGAENMEFQKCEGCGNEISSKEIVCPHCKCTIKNRGTKNEKDSFEEFLKKESKKAFIDICNGIKKYFINKQNKKIMQTPSILKTAEMEKTMKFDWANWNLGGRIIFVAACAATVSMFMDWISIGFASQSGLTQGAFLFLGLWVYPVLMLFKNKSISRAWGLVCSIASVVFTIAYIGSKSINLFGKTINAASTGAWLFFLVSIALIVGVIKYSPTKSVENKA